MDNTLVRRLKIWRRELWGSWWTAMTAIVALAANWDRFTGWFGYSERVGLARFIPQVSGATWFILWLLVTLVVLLEKVYRIAVDNDGLKAQLTKVREDQELSDLLSDKHEYGVHELLNRPPATPGDFDIWLKAEAEFTKSVLEIMKQHGCSKQEYRHVHTLGVIPIIALSQNPAIAHKLSMLVVRLGRIADIAGKYGD